MKLGTYGWTFDKLIEGMIFSLEGSRGEPPREMRVVGVDRDAGVVVYETSSGRAKMQARTWNHADVIRRRLVGLPDGVAESDDADVAASASMRAPTSAPTRANDSRAVADLVARIEALETIARESKEYLAELVADLRSREQR